MLFFLSFTTVEFMLNIVSMVTKFLHMFAPSVVHLKIQVHCE